MKHALAGVLALAGCGKVLPLTDAALDAPTLPDPELVEVALVSNAVNRELDLLFVIDDSPSMLDKQTNLKNSFASFVTTLSAGGVPDLHLGVITTDVGLKGEDDPTVPTNQIGSGPGSCSMVGKAGNLSTQGSNSVSGNFISDNGNGTTNYAGTLTSAFNEIASVGASGCGFEQPLHAMKRALDGNPNNAGFLRPNARLGIIILADEDDCSVRTPALFSTDTSTLGPLQSFRCVRFGVTCDSGGTTPDEMNQAGAKANCHSNETSTYLTDVARYTSFLRGLKADPRAIAFGAIVGNPTPVETVLRAPPGGGSAIPNVEHSCTYTNSANMMEVADPGVRLADVARSLPRGLVSSVCSANLQTQMTDIALRMKPLVGDACLPIIAQPANCEAFDDDGMGTLTPVPSCAEDSTPPCFDLVTDATACPAGSQHLKVNIVRSTPVPDTVWTSVRCEL